MNASPFSVKDPAEKVVLTFDFTAELGSATIPSASCSVELLAGTDASPSGLLSGSAQVVGATVLQMVRAGVANCDYNVKCTTGTTSDGRILVLAKVLPVRSA